MGGVEEDLVSGPPRLVAASGDGEPLDVRLPAGTVTSSVPFGVTCTPLLPSGSVEAYVVALRSGDRWVPITRMLPMQLGDTFVVYPPETL